MGGLSPEQRKAQILAGYQQNLDSQNQQGVYGTSGSGALGVGGYGAPRPSTPPTNIDTSSPAGRALLQSYQDSGVIFNDKGNVIYNPADLGASRANAVSIARGQGQQFIERGSPSQQYLKSLEAGGVDLRNITSTQKELGTLRAQSLQTKQAAEKEIADLEMRMQNLPSTLGLGSNAVLAQDNFLQGSRAKIERLKNQIPFLDRNIANIDAFASKKQKERASLGVQQTQQSTAIASPLTQPQRPARQAASQGRATGAIERQLAYQKSINTRVEGVKSPFNNIVETGQIKIRSPIQYSPLQGSTITARQLKDVKAGKSNESSILGLPQTRASGKVLPDILPSSTAFLSIPGITGAPNLLPQAFGEVPPLDAQQTRDIQNTIDKIKKSGAKTVTITTPSGRKQTVPVDQAFDFVNSNREAGTFNYQYGAGPSKQQQIGNLKITQGKILEVISKARKSGAKEITIIDESGKRIKSPLNRAFYDITKASRTSPTLSFEYGGLTSEQRKINLDTLTNARTGISNFVSEARKNYADEITITKEDGTKTVVPIERANLEINKATAGGKKVELSYEPTPPPITLANILESRSRLKETPLYQPLLSGAKYIDTLLQLDQPVKRRSDAPFVIPGVNVVLPGISNKQIGYVSQPLSNLAALGYDFGRDIKGVGPLANKNKQYTPLQYEPFASPLFEGKAPDLSKKEVQSSLAGQVLVVAATSGLGEATNVLSNLARGKPIGTRGGTGKGGSGPPKVSRSFEIPEAMRKPAGEPMRSLNNLYTDTIKLEAPKPRGLKELPNEAKNVIKFKLDDLMKQGFDKAAVRYNPQTRTIDRYIGQISLGKGKGFFPDRGGGGSSGGGPSTPSGGGPTVRVKPDITFNVGKLLPPTRDIFSMSQYENLGRAQPNIDVTKTGKLISPDTLFVGPNTIPKSSTSFTGGKLKINYPDAGIQSTARTGKPISLGRGIGKSITTKSNVPKNFIDYIANQVKAIENAGAINLRLRRSFPEFSYRTILGQGKGSLVKSRPGDFDTLFVGKGTIPKSSTSFTGGKLKINYPDAGIQSTARTGKKLPMLKEKEKPTMPEKKVKLVLPDTLFVGPNTIPKSSISFTGGKLKINYPDAGILVKQQYGINKPVRLVGNNLSSQINTLGGYGRQRITRTPPPRLRRGTRLPPPILVPITTTELDKNIIRLVPPVTIPKRKPIIDSIQINVPDVDTTPTTGKITIPKFDTPQKRKTRITTVPITGTPQRLITDLTFPETTTTTGRGRGRGGFFLPFGGGTGGTSRGYKRSKKKFVASEVDPLRAAVLLPDNVTELVGYTPKVFRQIDINLARERKRKGRTGGVDAEPFKGFSDKLLVRSNLGIGL